VPPSISTIRRLIGPAEVGLLAGDADVDVGRGDVCVGEKDDGGGLGVGAAAVEAELLVALELVLQRLWSLSGARVVQMGNEGGDGQALQAQRVAEHALPVLGVERWPEVGERAFGGGDREAVDGCAVEVPRAADEQRLCRRGPPEPCLTITSNAPSHGRISCAAPALANARTLPGAVRVAAHQRCRRVTGASPVT